MGRKPHWKAKSVSFGDFSILFRKVLSEMWIEMFSGNVVLIFLSGILGRLEFFSVEFIFPVPGSSLFRTLV